MTDEARLMPIIYVRGYAGTQRDVEDTVADPFMGFNLGSSKIRQRWTGKVERFYFESPFLRLMKEFGYTDTFHGDKDMPLPEDGKPRAIFIYRYYDATSSDFGSNQRLTIEDAASGLSDLILRIREFYCDNDAARDAFRVILVSHSMGGLICRCLLQNLNAGDASARKAVDKVFTYATPHNGIDFDILGNVPGFLSLNDANNFNRTRMAEYLALPKGTDDVSDLDGKFDPGRFFNLVGTNDRDYEVAGSMSRRAVGPMSDGLVRIKNATTSGRLPGTLADSAKIGSPRAFVNRSHSGYYGIVNSEEGYQNLHRFLFGNVRVDAELVVSSIALPEDVQKALNAGRKVRASYHIEVILRVRGQSWDLHRRIVDEDSAIFRKYEEIVPQAGAPPTRSPTLFSLFLSDQFRVDKSDPSLGFCVDLGVLVPEYEIDGKLWRKDHFEGGYLYRHKINFEATPPQAPGGDWDVKYGFDSERPNDVSKPAPQRPDSDGKGVIITIPVVQDTQPGIKADLILTASPWQ